MIPAESVLWAYTFAAAALFPPAPLFDGATGSVAAASRGPVPAARTAMAAPGLATLRAGDLAPAYGGDLYHRLHVSALTLAMGNVIGTQTRELRIWNAHLTSRRLLDVEFVDAGGIDLSAGDVPANLGPLSEMSWTVRVTQDGPPVIAARLIWLFDLTESISVAVTGNRVTAWIWLPDWGSPVLERLAWATDVLTSHDGTEQRRALRMKPRRAAEWSFIANGPARRMLENMTHGWGARVWARPDVPRGSRLSAAASAGATTLAFDTSLMGLAAGDMLMLHDGAIRHEIAAVTEVTVGGVSLERPLINAWPVGSRIYRAIAARLAQKAAFTHETDDLSRGTVMFDDIAPADWPAEHGLELYRGQPVLTMRHNWSELPGLDLERKLAVFDQTTGQVWWEDQSGHPSVRRTRVYLLVGRQAVEDFCRLLAWLQGRQGVVWLDSATTDMVAAAAMPGVGVTLDVEACGYALYVNAARNRRDLRLDTSAGVFLRRVIDAEAISSDVARITLDAALGVDLAAEDFNRISILSPSRLDADAVELAWVTDEIAQCRVAWRSVPDEL